MIATASASGAAAWSVLLQPRELAGCGDAAGTVSPMRLLYKRLRYALNQMTPEGGTSDRTPNTASTMRKPRRVWLLLLALPYAGLCFPALYARVTPALLGFPFFYWYQFAWVIATSGLLGLVYLKLREPE